MALSTYTELKAAVQTELDVSSLTDGMLVDAIKRCESRLNRRLRLREMEQLTTDTLSAGTTTISLPAGYLELFSVQAKLSSEADANYVDCQYVAPELAERYYDKRLLRYTLRDELEFFPVPTSDYTVRLHWLKAWNLATDSSNWLLTNHPDAYFYGTLMECERTLRNDDRSLMWRAELEAVIEYLNALSERGRDDGQLITSESASMAGALTFDIWRG